MITGSLIIASRTQGAHMTHWRQKPPVDLVHAEVPHIVAAVVLVFFLAIVAMWVGILSHERPSCRAGGAAALFTDCRVTR